jgi:hypothetical protein
LPEPLKQGANPLPDALVSRSPKAQAERTTIDDAVFRERPGIVLPGLHAHVGPAASDKLAFFERRSHVPVANPISSNENSLLKS